MAASTPPDRKPSTAAAPFQATEAAAPSEVGQAPGMPSPRGWPRSIRLRKRRDFAQIQRVGARAANPLMVVLCRKTRGPDPQGRLGFAVSKKVGDAPVRNLVKRRLRHLARTQKPLWEGLDLVLLLRPEAGTASFAALDRALNDGVNRAREALAKAAVRQHKKRRSAPKTAPGSQKEGP